VLEEPSHLSDLPYRTYHAQKHQHQRPSRRLVRFHNAASVYGSMHHVADKNNSVISGVGVDTATRCRHCDLKTPRTPSAILYTSQWRVKHRICVVVCTVSVHRCTASNHDLVGLCVFYSLVLYGLKWVRFDSRYRLDTRFMDSILRVHKLFRCSTGF